jgi:hypothetical protein
MQISCVLQLQVAHPVGLVDQTTVAQGPGDWRRMDVLRQAATACHCRRITDSLMQLAAHA